MFVYDGVVDSTVLGKKMYFLFVLEDGEAENSFTPNGYRQEYEEAYIMKEGAHVQRCPRGNAVR